MTAHVYFSDLLSCLMTAWLAISWLKIDDKMPENTKVMALSDAAFRLWMNALCYAARNETDGFVPEAALKGLGGSSRRANELLGAGLWHLVGGESLGCRACDELRPLLGQPGWMLHSYLDYNPSAKKQKKLRQEASARMTSIRDGSRVVRANKS